MNIISTSLLKVNNQWCARMAGRYSDWPDLSDMLLGSDLIRITVCCVLTVGIDVSSRWVKVSNDKLFYLDNQMQLIELSLEDLHERNCIGDVLATGIEDFDALDGRATMLTVNGGVVSQEGSIYLNKKAQVEYWTTLSRIDNRVVVAGWNRSLKTNWMLLVNTSRDLVVSVMLPMDENLGQFYNSPIANMRTFTNGAAEFIIGFRLFRFVDIVAVSQTAIFVVQTDYDVAPKKAPAIYSVVATSETHWLLAGYNWIRRLRIEFY